ncbi:hypothetical protein OSTOST_23443, partial [Ostertagia ostertagi]
WPVTSSTSPRPAWQQPSSSQPPPPSWSPRQPEWTPAPPKLPPPARNKTSPVVGELSYDVIEERKTLPEHTSRFVVKPGKQRKKFNPQLHTERGCTDVVCCFLFLVFTAGWGVVATIVPSAQKRLQKCGCGASKPLER